MLTVQFSAVNLLLSVDVYRPISVQIKHPHLRFQVNRHHRPPHSHENWGSWPGSTWQDDQLDRPSESIGHREENNDHARPQASSRHYVVLARKRYQVLGPFRREQATFAPPALFQDSHQVRGRGFPYDSEPSCAWERQHVPKSNASSWPHEFTLRNSQLQTNITCSLCDGHWTHVRAWNSWFDSRSGRTNSTKASCRASFLSWRTEFRQAVLLPIQLIHWDLLLRNGTCRLLVHWLASLPEGWARLRVTILPIRDGV